MKCRRSILVGMWMLAIASSAVAAEPAVDFRRDVRPILAQLCFTCHGPDEGTRETELRLDLAQSVFDESTGSELPAVSPGHPERSELWLRLTSEDESLRMPPPESGRSLSDEQLDQIRRWIEQGADYPSHWAFERPQPPVIPVVRRGDWPRGAIDHFVLANLERRDVEPSPEADRETLIRRLSLDLLGLPPTPDEVDRFVADDSPLAYENLVDRLFASPHFGERWGKHWLDLARYADSNGYLGDSLRPNAYLYRDWVLEAINADLPFDRFTIEQLAGDLLDRPTFDQRLATGFHRNAMKNTEAGADREEDRVNRTVNYVSTTGAVWLGLTVGCAECHTHKYDPISHHEFYRLYAFFNNTEEQDVTVPAGPAVAANDADPSEEVAKAEAAKIKAPAMTEGKKDRRTTFVHVRGSFRDPGDEVEAGTPSVLHPLRPRRESADRLDLAHWLVDPDNPLTHRVTVNHLWKHLFGHGLVPTADNFGITGEPPSHPELLDYLALELVRSGWSRKALLRQIVTSATYRQSSNLRSELRQRDPLNRWLARQSRYRLEAEVIRDSALAVGDLLNIRIGGPSIRPPLDPRVTQYSRNKDWPVSPGVEKYRRGLYVLFRRNTPYSMLVTFDAPDTSVACTQRERTHSPLQALVLLNDPVFHECAQHWGRGLARMGDCEPRVWITAAFRTGLARHPTKEELDRLVAFYQEQRTTLDGFSAADLQTLIGEPVAEGLELAEQAARVVVARGLINVNEFITRE